MQVYVTSTRGHWNVRFHATAECAALRRGQRRAKRPKPVQEVDLAELERPEPCRVCYPTAPAVKVWHPRCQDGCNGSILAPCEHNGGVLVQTKRRGQWVPGGDWDPDRTVRRYRYVWPENAHHYDLVEAPLA